MQLSEAAFGKLCGVSRGSVQQWESGATAPSRKRQEVVARVLGITIAELMSSDETAPLSNQDSGNLVIRQYKSGGSMGRGVVLRDQPGVIQSWQVSPEWVQKNVHHITSPSNLAIVTGFGDSMRPLYNPGDPLLVDTGVKTVEFDAIYFFRIEDEGFIKRLQRIPGVGLRAISENKAYDSWEITKGMDFEVFARVVKVWRGEDF